MTFDINKAADCARDSKKCPTVGALKACMGSGREDKREERRLRKQAQAEVQQAYGMFLGLSFLQMIWLGFWIIRNWDDIWDLIDLFTEKQT